MLKVTFHLFLPATIFLFFSGCIFAPPDGPRLRSEVISAIGPRSIVIDQIEAVDQMGWYRVIDTTQISFSLDNIELYHGAKPGDRVWITLSDKNGRIIIRKGDFAVPNVVLFPELSEGGLEYQPIVTVVGEFNATDAEVENKHTELKPISVPER